MDRENSWGDCVLCGKLSDAQLAGFDYVCVECAAFLCLEACTQLSMDSVGLCVDVIEHSSLHKH